jgi:hypothetical protein
MSETTVFETGKATLYVTSDFGFGYTKIEVKSIKVTERPYAQYDKAFKVTYVRAGKRKAQDFFAYGRNGRFIIVEGWGRFNVADWMTRETEADGTELGHSRHLSCDPAWDDEFDAALKASGEVVAFDGRPAKGAVAA